MSEPDKLVRKSLRGALVLAGVTALQFLVGFGSQFVLAWLLLPEHFGALAFAATVADFIKTLMQITGRRYVIKEQSNWQSAVDNAFTLELILGVITVISIGALGLPIMNALGRPEATCFVQILVFAVFTNPFSQLGALYERDLRFGRANIPVAAAVLTEAATSIFLAALGFGTWSLVWGRVARFATMILLYWAVTPYRPRLTFNIPVWREAFAFGAPLTATAVLIFFYWNIDYYIVGRLLNDVQLGYYYLAFQFNAYALKVRSNISAVVFPAFCRAGSDPVIVQGFNLLTRYTAIVFLAISVLILAFGPEIIGVTLGEEWSPSIVPFQILSVATAWRAITSYWDPVLVSKGRTRPFLVAAVLNALVIPTTGYFLTLSHGIIGMAFAVLAAVILTTPIQVIALKRVIKVSYGAILGRPILVALLHLGGSWLIARLIDATTLPGLLLVVGLSLGLWIGMALILIPDLRRDVRRLWRVLRSSLPSSAGS